MADEFERAIARHRRELMALDRSLAREIVTAHDAVLRGIQGDIDKLLDQISSLRAGGQDVPLNRLFRLDRYERMIFDLNRHTDAFIVRATERLREAKRSAAGMPNVHVREQTLAALGPAPPAAVAEIAGAFARVPVAVIDQIARNAADGTPLAQLFREIAPLHERVVRNALAAGIGAGKGVREIARDIANASSAPRARALTIARTETLRAYRQTTTSLYTASDLVTGWIWHAELDGRTCPLCWAQHGTAHPPGELLAAHVNCRCTQVPRTKSWEELGFSGIRDTQPAAKIPLGSDLFAQLPGTTQRGILGPARHDAYQKGELALSDLVGYQENRWGRSVRMRTLADLGLR